MSTRLLKAREAAFHRQSGLCYYCKMPLLTPHIERDVLATAGLTVKLAKRLSCTAEHLVPRSSGGSSDTSNIVAACLFCNQTRHKIKKVPPPERYGSHVQKRIAAGRWHPPELIRAARVLRRVAAA